MNKLLRYLCACVWKNLKYNQTLVFRVLSLAKNVNKHVRDTMSHMSVERVFQCKNDKFCVQIKVE